MTFAGSPDRVESQLVPEAGFELDTFAVSGFPRRIGLGLVRALSQAVRAPFACSRILARRRPDVVLGGGGYVAGPMVLAARLRGIPAALTEADAHLGLANRLAAPFARRVFLAYAIPGRDGRKYRVVGRPIPAAHLGAGKAEGRALFGLPPDAPVLAVFGGLAGAQALNEFAVEAFGEHGSCGSARFGGARLRGRAPAGASRRLRARRRRPTSSVPLSRRPTSRSRVRAGRSGSSRPPERRRSSFRIRTRPPITRRRMRSTSRAAAARSSSTRVSSRVFRRSWRSCWPTRQGSRACARAMLALAEPDAAGVVADELIALAEARTVSALAARRPAALLRGDRRRRALRVRELRPRLGRRGAWLGRARHDLPRGGHGCRRGHRRRARAARRLRGRRLGGTRWTDRRTLASRVPRRAGRASPLDRRRRRARQDDHGGDGRVRPSRARSRPRVDHRRRRAAARRKRRHGRGLARRRGRRVRPLDRVCSSPRSRS